ncbi:MAG: HaeIII family restriction endonuclease, partial [Candidatus Bathyarchaeia archaeon]
MPISDALGRAFEYCVTEAIFAECQKLFPNKVHLSSRAKDMQQRDRERLDVVDYFQRMRFQSSGAKIARWLAENKLKKIEEITFERAKTLTTYIVKEAAYESIEKVEIDRIPDVAGVKGDVTDIRIKVFLKGSIATVNVSLKHRHEALKHPRLTRVPEWIGLAGTKEEREYLKAYEQIWEDFFQKGKALLPSAQCFRDLKSVDPDFIEVNLYRPLYRLVGNFIQNNAKTSAQVQRMFNFLVGTSDYVKFIARNGRTEIRDFSKTTKPNSVKVEYKGEG